MPTTVPSEVLRSGPADEPMLAHPWINDSAAVAQSRARRIMARPFWFGLRVFRRKTTRR
ncbi:hypothetical protein VARIO8X_50475 [Burkholderiales bacterium 8X]|nr:hypothetical protein VARIO8X_50475 [Burkholderiales bacterium 8X]